MPENLTIGSVTLDDNSAWFEIHREGLRGGTGRINKVRHLWTINGRVNGADSSEVDTKVTELESAVVDGIDISFSLGSTMSLTSADCFQGTHIKSFSWLKGTDNVRGSGAEGVLRRSFRLVVFGDILTSVDTDITQWSETFTQIGNGGPRVIPVGSLLGDIQAQQLQAKTPFTLLQSGFALGLTTHPDAPAAAYFGVPGVHYDPASMTAAKSDPKEWGINKNTQYGVRWGYRCWSISPLIGSVSSNAPFDPTPV